MTVWHAARSTFLEAWSPGIRGSPGKAGKLWKKMIKGKH